MGHAWESPALLASLGNPANAGIPFWETYRLRVSFQFVRSGYIGICFPHRTKNFWKTIHCAHKPHPVTV